MTDNTIVAYTPLQLNYPPYLNISEVDGKIRITVRSNSTVQDDFVFEGQTAFIDLDKDAAYDIFTEAFYKVGNMTGNMN